MLKQKVLKNIVIILFLVIFFLLGFLAKQNSTKISNMFTIKKQTSFEVLKTIELPQDFVAGDMQVFEAIKTRRSIREYSEKSLSLPELATLLYTTQGKTSQYGRSAPSAGGLYPMETYLVVNRVEDLESGLYHYNVENHSLELLRLGNLGNEIKNVAFDQSSVEEAAVDFIWTAVPIRTTQKYGERGHRYIDMEAGHISQNLYLQGNAMGLGVVAVGGFSVDGVNEFLGVDGVYETTIYMNAVGRK